MDHNEGLVTSGGLSIILSHFLTLIVTIPENIQRGNYTTMMPKEFDV
jgi:hypothetical protein